MLNEEVPLCPKVCLLGVKVDGGEKNNPYVLEMIES